VRAGFREDGAVERVGLADGLNKFGHHVFDLATFCLPVHFPLKAHLLVSLILADLHWLEFNQCWSPFSFSDVAATVFGQVTGGLLYVPAILGCMRDRFLLLIQIVVAANPAGPDKLEEVPV